jgi:Killing trait
MAYPTPVNSYITDAITQQGLQVLGNASAMAMGSIYQSSAHSIGILYQNAVQAQRQASICAQAATNQGVIQLYSSTSMASAVATSKIAKSDNIGQMITLLTLMRALRR